LRREVKSLLTSQVTFLQELALTQLPQLNPIIHVFFVSPIDNALILKERDSAKSPKPLVVPTLAVDKAKYFQKTHVLAP
jgi:hypothetical protein